MKRDLSRRGMLLVAGAILVLAMTTWFAATAIAGSLQEAFGLDAVAASWLTNAVQLGFVSGALGLSLSGLADTLPLRTLMAGAAALAGLSTLALLVVPDRTLLFAARYVTGFALAGVYPPALKLIATWFVRGRGLAMGASLGAVTFGSALPYLLRATSGRVAWHGVVIGAAAASLLAAGLALTLVRPGPHAAAPPRAAPGRILAVLRDPALGLANLGYFGHMWELYAMWGGFSAYAEAARIGQPALLAFCVIATGSLGCVSGGVLGDRIGRTATAGAMMLISGTCAGAIGLAVGGPPWLFIALALVWGFAIIGDSAQFSAMISELSDRDTMGAALALQIGVGFALTIVSIRLLPTIAEAVGWRWSFALLAPGPFIGAAAMAALRRLPRAAAIAQGRR